MRYLVTGAAGFIGCEVSLALSLQGHDVVGLDSINTYYDPSLKLARLRRLEKIAHFSFVKMDLCDKQGIDKLFREHRFDRVVHLGAQAGVRYSLTHPHAYTESNITGTLNILEGCRNTAVGHLVYASSSSVYGLNEDVPFSVTDNVDHPVSLYAATKKSNELMAHCYAHLYQLPVTGLRFFTVYGPWGRPDMAYFMFTKKILNDEPIDVFNNGDLARDFTYITDIVEGVVRTAHEVPKPSTSWSGMTPDPATSKAPYRLFNIGNSSPVKLLDFIASIEKALGKEAKKNFLPMQPGDVEKTYADIAHLEQVTGFKPSTPLDDGIANFVTWYKDYYQV